MYNYIIIFYMLNKNIMKTAILRVSWWRILFSRVIALSMFVSFTFAAVDHFEVSVSPDSFVEGALVDLTVQAIDEEGNIDTSYLWNVWIEIEGFDYTDPDVTIPGWWIGMFKETDNGVKIFEKSLSVKESWVYKIIVADVYDTTVKGEIDFKVVPLVAADDNREDDNSISVVEFLDTYLASDIPMTDIHRMFIEGINERLDKYEEDEQPWILNIFVEKLKQYKKMLNILWLDETKLLHVLEYVVDLFWKDELVNNDFSSSTVSTDTDITYEVFPAKEKWKKVVVFSLESEKQIRRATWHWPDGSTYSCEMNNCKQIPRVREPNTSYKVVVYINYGYHESARQEIVVELYAGTSTIYTAEMENNQCKAYTWIAKENIDGYQHVWCDYSGWDETCNAYQGDTDVTIVLPVLCYKPTGEPHPEIVPAKNFYHERAAGEIALTKPILWTKLTSLNKANSLCEEQFWLWWRMGEHHDGAHWNYWAKGNIATGIRFWVHIDDQNANPWDCE